MADTIEYSSDQVYSAESPQQLTTYDECEWKTFQREQTESATSPHQYIDDIDSGGQQAGVDL